MCHLQPQMLRQVDRGFFPNANHTQASGRIGKKNMRRHKIQPEAQAVHKGIVAELPNLMPPRSARLPLDTKHPRENTKLLGSIGHTPGENPKIHIFAIRITNERIKLTSFVTISYITFNTTSEYNIY